jgi:hypothetical protein
VITSSADFLPVISKILISAFLFLAPVNPDKLIVANSAAGLGN